MIGIDRARRTLSETSLGIVIDITEANPSGFYCVFGVVWVVLGDFGVEGGH